MVSYTSLTHPTVLLTIPLSNSAILVAKLVTGLLSNSIIHTTIDKLQKKEISEMREKQDREEEIISLLSKYYPDFLEQLSSAYNKLHGRIKKDNILISRLSLSLENLDQIIYQLTEPNLTIDINNIEVSSLAILICYFILEIKNSSSPIYPNYNREAIALWREKLAAFRKEEAITADAPQKFQLKKQIQECNENIERLNEEQLNYKSEREQINKSVKEEFDKWGQKYISSWKTIYQIITNETEQTRIKIPNPNNLRQKPCLLVKVDKVNNCFSFESWLIDDSNTYQPSQGTGCKKIIVDNIDFTTQTSKINEHLLINYLRSSYQQAINLSHNIVEKIHIFLPHQMIEEENKAIDLLILDQHEIDQTDETPDPRKPLGVECEVIIRFSERIQSNIRQPVNKPTQLWLNKCKLLHQNKNKCLSDLDAEIPQFSFNQDYYSILGTICKQKTIGARLELLQSSYRKKIMQLFYREGIPFAIWCRETNNSESQANLTTICNQCQLHNLSSHLREKKEEAWSKLIEQRREKSEQYYHEMEYPISLLWDDDRLLPPDHLLEMS